MSQAHRHTFQVLTKRHARMRALLTSEPFQDKVFQVVNEGDTDVGYRWPLPNVWVGVFVEDQRWADIRIPALLATPAAVRWISAEPLLGALDLRLWLPAGKSNRLGRLVPFDNQVWQQGVEQGDNVSRSSDGPLAYRLPATALYTLVVPGNDTADRRLKPIDGFGRSAVDRDAHTATRLGSSTPVEVPFPVEHASDVAEHGRLGREVNALGRMGTHLSASDSTGLVDPTPDGRAGAPNAVGNLWIVSPAT